MRRSALILAAVILAAAGLAGLHWRRVRRARRTAECARDAAELDRGLRAKLPLIFEGLRRPQLAADSGRCVALLEYHYRPCDARERAAGPQACAGPDADIGVYDVALGRLLFGCEKRGATMLCTRRSYTRDGRPGAFQTISPEDFPRLRAALIRD